MPTNDCVCRKSSLYRSVIHSEVHGIFLSLLVHVMQRPRMLLLSINVSCCIRWQ